MILRDLPFCHPKLSLLFYLCCNLFSLLLLCHCVQLQWYCPFSHFWHPIEFAPQWFCASASEFLSFFHFCFIRMVHNWWWPAILRLLWLKWPKAFHFSDLFLFIDFSELYHFIFLILIMGFNSIYFMSLVSFCNG